MTKIYSGATDTSGLASLAAANSFTSTPQTVTADADGDTNLSLVHTEVSPAGYFLEMKSETSTQRIAFGGINSAIGGWGLRLSGSGTITIQATDNIIYVGSSETLTIGSGALSNKVLVGGTSAVQLGFYGTAPISKQTGVALSTAGIHAALVNLGLIS